MVRLYISLLAVALAAGPAVAFSDQYQRRSELDSDLYSREFDSQEIPFTREDHEEPYGREVSDDPEARAVSRVIKHGAGRGLVQTAQNPSSQQRRDLEDLEAREPQFGGLVSGIIKVGTRIGTRVGNAGKALNLANNYPVTVKSVPRIKMHRREFDSQEIPFTREDHEEPYGREVSDDLEARAAFGAVKVAKQIGQGIVKIANKPSVRIATKAAVHTAAHVLNAYSRRRDLEDLYGREFVDMLLDERDIFDDLD